MSTADKGILHDTLLPSFALHSGFAVAAWAAGSSLDRLDTKDWAWPTSLVANAWWSAVGRRLLNGEPLSRVVGSISRPEWLLLVGPTLWGGRLFYRIATRSLARGEDDPKYAHAKASSSFSWVKMLASPYLVDALVQSFIALPFTAPFRHQGQVLTGYDPFLQGVAVGVFSIGFALEIVADYQLQKHREETGHERLLTGGVRSIVRHPNYLGDALMHISYPLMLFASDMLAPVELLGPVANYLYLRFIGGTKQLEQYQRRRYSIDRKEKLDELDRQALKKNSFWPKVKEMQNGWTWAVIGCGVAGVAVERGIWSAMGYYS